MADNVRDELAGTLKSILDTGKYSDLIITCHGDTYNVHKAIVCSRSGFFERAENFPGKESEEGKVDLPEDEPNIIKLLVRYLYNGEYDPKLPDGKCMDSFSVIEYTGRRVSGYQYEFPHTCLTAYCSMCVCEHHICSDYCYGNPCKDFVCKSCCPNAGPTYITLPPPDGDAEQLLLHAKMYEIGDKYDVIGLKQLAREKFLRVCNEYWDTEYFAPAAHYAFSTTPEEEKGLRDVISNVISQHMALLKKPAVETLLDEFNGLAVGLLKLKAKDIGKYSDFTIICGDETHKVHKNIVCTRCGFFERAERFAVGREATENAIKLPEDEPKIITLLLEFLYTGKYTPKLAVNDLPANSLPQSRFPHTCNANHVFQRLCAHHNCGIDCRYDCRAFRCMICPRARPKDDKSQLLIHSKLYSLADKYDIPGLQDLAAAKFKAACADFWHTEAFPVVAEHVFISTPDTDTGLRAIVKTLLLEYKQDLVKKAGIKTFLEKRPKLMYELLAHDTKVDEDDEV